MNAVLTIRRVIEPLDHSESSKIDINFAEFPFVVSVCLPNESQYALL